MGLGPEPTYVASPTHLSFSFTAMLGAVRTSNSLSFQNKRSLKVPEGPHLVALFSHFLVPVLPSNLKELSDSRNTLGKGSSQWMPPPPAHHSWACQGAGSPG